jgi:hypothetical protein
MTDSETTHETVPTMTYLPDHLLAGQSKIPAVRTIDDDRTDDEETDGEASDTDSDPTAEFCRSWRRHRSRSRSFPF